MRVGIFCLMALPILIAGCQPGEGPLEEENSVPVRNIIAQVVEPQELEVDIKLPVVIRPDEVFELRAARAGKIVSLPFKEGDVVPPSQVPEGDWIEEKAFIADNADATPEQIAMRNMRHLAGYAAFARLDISELVQSLMEAQTNYDQAVRDLKRAEDYSDSTGAQLDDARTRKAAARVMVNRAILMIEDTFITNPKTTVLTELLRKEGEYVNPGELIARVAVLETLVAELEIPEAHRRQLKIGEELEIRIGSMEDADGHPERRTGRITRIERVAHAQTHSFTVEVSIANKDLALPAGIFGTTYVTIYSNPMAQMVPLSAVNLVGDKKSLFVLTDGDGSVKELNGIRLGQMNYRWVEVLSPDIAGKRVVTFGAQNLSDGDAVNATEKDPYVVESGKGGE